MQKSKTITMSQYNWKSSFFLLPLVTMVILCDGRLSNYQTMHQVFDKYKCRLKDSPSVSRSSTLGVKLSRVILDCGTQQVIYKNITAEEFRKGNHENENTLELSSLGRTLTENEFCMANHSTQSFGIVLCDEHVHINTYSSSPITIRKCCKPNQKIEENLLADGTVEFNCMEMPTDAKQENWRPAFFASTSDDYSKHMDLEFNSSNEYDIGYGFPNCSSARHSLTNSEDIWFMLLESGSVEIGLKFWFKPVWLPVKDNEFCLDEVVDHDPWSHNMTEIDSHESYHKYQTLVYCQIAHFDDYLFHRKLFGSMCVTAAGVVFILLVIYLAIWDKQNLAGWTQFNIFVSLFFVVLMEGLRTLLDVNGLEVKSTTGCAIIAAIAQYFFFAFNTTWTVMCFDLFYMFWKLETTSKTVARYKGRLILYLLFSWGLPLLVVSIAFPFTHSTATEEMSKLEGVYAFAHRRCSSPIRKLGFQTQGIMFLVNLLFFLLTTALIWKHRRGLNPATKRTRNERYTWRSVNLFLKLVVVMGVTSLSIPLDYFFGSSDPLSNTAVCFRMVHFVPFVAVLFIFGFNEKNMVLISQKYPRVGKYFGFVACTSGANTSETANHSRSGNCNRISEHPSSPTN